MFLKLTLLSASAGITMMSAPSRASRLASPLRSEPSTTEPPNTDAASTAVSSTSAAVRPGFLSRFLIGR